MHCLRKISNKNSLQFRHYRCLNVAYGYILVPLQLHFQLRKCKIVGWTQIRGVWGWSSLLREQHAVPVVLLSTYMAQIMHTVFVFSNHQRECGEWWCLVSRTLLSFYNWHSGRPSKQLPPERCFSLLSLFHTTHSTLRLQLILTRHKQAMPLKYRSTWHRSHRMLLQTFPTFSQP